MKLIFRLIVICNLLCSAAYSQNSTQKCLLSLKNLGKVKARKPDNTSSDTHTGYPLQTLNGEVKISILEEYLKFYELKFRDEGERTSRLFVSLFIRTLDAGSFSGDSLKIIEYLKYERSRLKQPESADLTVIDYNGFKFIGTSSATLKQENDLATFVLFPGNNYVVFFDFSNNPGIKNYYNTIDEFRSRRNDFFAAYSNQIKKCLK